MISSLVALLSLIFTAVLASPVPALEIVTVTHVTTIWVDHKWAKPEGTKSSSSAAETSATVVASTMEAEWEPSTAPTLVTLSSTTVSSTLTAVATSSVVASSATTSSVVASSTSSAATSTASSSPTGSVFSGEGTYYSTGLGACGITSVDTDYIVAISHELFDEYTPNGNPNKNSLCGKKIQASYEGKSVEVTVVDRCEGCKYYDLDFSPSAFQSIADESLGRIDITWLWA